jgi:hypothetical protein
MVAPYRVRTNQFPNNPPLPAVFEANPNAPAVQPRSRGVVGAVVYLKGVDPERARPWDWAPVTVEQRGRQFHVLQGKSATRIGFVRRGDAVTMVSRDPVFHALHAGGAAFFTLAFPDAGRSSVRRLNDKGLVELTSAAGYYWMRAYLFVDDHPYYARTDARGRFTLRGVPPGRYRLVCWLPDWRERRHERDPESGLVTRLYFRPPRTKTKPVTVPPKGTVEGHFHFSGRDFSE